MKPPALRRREDAATRSDREADSFRAKARRDRADLRVRSAHLFAELFYPFGSRLLSDRGQSRSFRGRAKRASRDLEGAAIALRRKLCLHDLRYHRIPEALLYGDRRRAGERGGPCEVIWDYERGYAPPKSAALPLVRARLLSLDKSPHSVPARLQQRVSHPSGLRQTKTQVSGAPYQPFSTGLPG